LWCGFGAWLNLGPVLELVFIAVWFWYLVKFGAGFGAGFYCGVVLVPG
jgi:hypothetical protein